MENYDITIHTQTANTFKGLSDALRTNWQTETVSSLRVKVNLSTPPRTQAVVHHGKNSSAILTYKPPLHSSKRTSGFTASFHLKALIHSAEQTRRQGRVALLRGEFVHGDALR